MGAEEFDGKVFAADEAVCAETVRDEGATCSEAAAVEGAAFAAGEVAGAEADAVGGDTTGVVSADGVVVAGCSTPSAIVADGSVAAGCVAPEANGGALGANKAAPGANSAAPADNPAAPGVGFCLGFADAPLMVAACEVLKTHFGYSSFRPGQEELVGAVLSGRDILGVMPTGAGKSICYQVPGMVLPGLTLVVSPLVSLMGDQVRALLQAGVRGSYLNSTLTPGQQATVMRRALEGQYDVMYVAPERLADPRFVEFASQAPIPLVAVDEAHCVSQWGQDFRPAYLGIGAFIASLPQRPIVAALTATATQRVREDISALLGLENPFIKVTGFDRPNLHFAVEQLAGKRKMARVVNYALEHPSDSGIVYCSTRKEVEKLQEALVEEGVRAVRYHAGLTVGERTEAQEAFVSDDAPVMVATNAFGMGIDKSNVRYVIHNNMPASLEAYYQEAGRAGRDGEPSECLLLWNDGDIGTCRFFIEQEVENEALTPEEHELVRASRRRLLGTMTGYCLTTHCLRRHILEYFGDDSATDCGNCSNCEGGFEAIDVTLQARAVMRCVQELRGRYGKGMVVDVLHGSKSQRLFEFGLETAKTYGSVPDESTVRLKEIIEILASEGYLLIEEGRYPLVGLGLRAREAAEPSFELRMKRPAAKVTRLKGADGAERVLGASGERKKKPKAAEGLDPMDADLFERLRTLRKRIADEATVPPYVVFSDATLRGMCLARPANEEQFLEVSGVGQAKLERYGKQFLAEINA